jgi:hypothetical protein
MEFVNVDVEAPQPLMLTDVDVQQIDLNTFFAWCRDINNLLIISAVISDKSDISFIIPHVLIGRHRSTP